MKSVTMISWELDPLYIRGGTAYAIRRLADQLTRLGIDTKVFLPDWRNAGHRKHLASLPMASLLKMRAGLHRAPRVQQCTEFCRVALEAFEQNGTAESDAVIAHGDEGAMFIILRNGERSRQPWVFWLHSLYDPSTNDLTKEQRRRLPSHSLLASAVMMADIVVTSTGILQDAREFEWPERLGELQQALITASAANRVLTVESLGCLPPVTGNSHHKLNPGSNVRSLNQLPLPYVLFPCRPTVDKGLGIFAAVAERLRADNIACVAMQPPAPRARLKHRYRKNQVQWLPWLTQDELPVVMRHAACTVLPSITEGFGLAAAESISQGVSTLYQQVGGHHGLEVLPNALPVPLTPGERSRLYSLWAELIDIHPDSWPVWKRHETSLRPLVDRWVGAIKSVVHHTNGGMRRIENNHFPIEDCWGSKLLRRIESGTNV